MLAHGDLFDNGTIYEMNRARAFSLFDQAARLGNVNGMQRLAFYYKECYPGLYRTNSLSYCKPLPGPFSQIEAGYYLSLYWCVRAALTNDKWALENVRGFSYIPDFIIWVNTGFPKEERITEAELQRLDVTKSR